MPISQAARNRELTVHSDGRAANTSAAVMAEPRSRGCSAWRRGMLLSFLPVVVTADPDLLPERQPSPENRLAEGDVRHEGVSARCAGRPARSRWCKSIAMEE